MDEHEITENRDRQEEGCSRALQCHPVAQGEEPRHDGYLSAERHWRWRGVDPTGVDAEVFNQWHNTRGKSLTSLTTRRGAEERLQRRLTCTPPSAAAGR